MSPAAGAMSSMEKPIVVVAYTPPFKKRPERINNSTAAANNKEKSTSSSSIPYTPPFKRGRRIADHDNNNDPSTTTTAAANKKMKKTIIGESSQQLPKPVDAYVPPFKRGQIPRADDGICIENKTSSISAGSPNPLPYRPPPFKIGTTILDDRSTVLKTSTMKSTSSLPPKPLQPYRPPPFMRDRILLDDRSTMNTKSSAAEEGASCSTTSSSVHPNPRPYIPPFKRGRQIPAEEITHTSSPQKKKIKATTSSTGADGTSAADGSPAADVAGSAVPLAHAPAAGASKYPLRIACSSESSSEEAFSGPSFASTAPGPKSLPFPSFLIVAPLPESLPFPSAWVTILKVLELAH